MTRNWLKSYNVKQPHNMLGNLPPTLFREGARGELFCFRSVHLTVRPRFSSGTGDPKNCPPSHLERLTK
jgi:hypothetical protein